MSIISRCRRLYLTILVILVIGIFSTTSLKKVKAGFPAQIPTGSIPTVTGTPVGALAIVLDNEQGFINVRGGPSTVAYDIVGVLVEGSQVPALGKTPGGDWIQISYPGVPGGVAWVYTDLLVVNGSLSRRRAPSYRNSTGYRNYRPYTCGSIPCGDPSHPFTYIHSTS